MPRHLRRIPKQKIEKLLGYVEMSEAGGQMVEACQLGWSLPRTILQTTGQDRPSVRWRTGRQTDQKEHP